MEKSTSRQPLEATNLLSPLEEHTLLCRERELSLLLDGDLDVCDAKCRVFGKEEDNHPYFDCEVLLFSQQKTTTTQTYEV